MLPIVGQPMIERVLAHLGQHGIDHAILSLGYLPDAFKEAYPDGKVGGVRLSYAVEPEPLDTAGAVHFAATYAGVDDTFLVVNGDVLTDMDITTLVRFHRANAAEGTISLHPVDDPSAYGVVPTDETGRVTAFVEKPPRDEAPTNLINAGTYVLEPSVLDRIPASRRVSIERETFPAMVKAGRLFALADDSYWLDAGTPSAYLAAHRDLAQGRRNGPPAPGLERGQGEIWTEGSPTLDGELAGACVVFDGADVAPGARVESSVLGRGAVVEKGSTVIDSVLLDGARVASNSIVTGSILGPRSTVGERCDVRPTSVLGTGAVVPSGSVIDDERIA